MKWLLVVIVLQTPVKTDLVFESLSACLSMEIQMRNEWVSVYNKTKAKFQANEEFEKMKEHLERQMTWGTCIPTK